MKKIAIFLASISIWALALPALAAVDIGIGSGGTGMVGDVAKQGGFNTSGVTDTTLSETIGRIIKIVLSLLGTIFFVLIVYAGVLWTTAGGNDEQVTKATSIIRSAMIGLILVLAAYGLTVFIMVAVLRSTGFSSGAPQQASFWSFFKNNWSRFVF